MDASGWLEAIKAWREIESHITDNDIVWLEELDLDSTDLVEALIGLLVNAGIDPEQAEELLTRAGFLEGEPA